MRHCRIFIGLAWILLASFDIAQAQNEADAMRYMTPTGVGTARALGMASAFSAVGADFTATTLNPAGLALYRRSEFMITPAVRLIQDKTNYLDGTGQDGYGKFGFSNVGYVFADRVYKWDPQTQSRQEAQSGLRSYAFSLGFNQTAQMGRNAEVSGFNPNSSITQYFATQAQGLTVSEIEADNGYAGQAWWAYAIDTSASSPGGYIGAANGGKVQQKVSLGEIGRTNEWTVGFAANVNDKLYFGGTLGIQDLRYQQEQVFEERDTRNVHNSWANDSTPYARSVFTTGFQTKGSGVNLRVGMIAKPVDFLRIGVSVTTPTALQCVDSYYSRLEGYLDSDTTTAESLQVPDGAFAYTFTQPFKATVGAMALIGKRGFVSADFDYMDYTTAKFKTKSVLGSSYYYSFTDENKAIRDLFAGAYNLRLGGELRFGVGRARLGYGHYGSILKKKFLDYYPFPVDPVSPEVKSLRGGKNLFSVGLGIKQKSWYLDLAFVHETSADRKLLYTLADPYAYSPELVQHITSNNIYMTIGFTF